MTFLPIVQRELRVAARRKSTFRIRLWTAVLAMLVTWFSLFFLWVGSGGRGNVGDPLFNIVTGYAFGLCLLAGIFLTADSLTEEKREGTLGFLFLTDLKGYDVVLGKFIATSINAFYGLFALLPVSGLALVLGGVTVGEFWRTALALINTLFVSLAIGVCVSAFARDSRRATSGTFLAVILLAIALPLLTRLIPWAGLAAAWERLVWVSPLYAFSFASEEVQANDKVRYWASLAASNVFGWFLLGLASYLAPRRWQEGVARAPAERGFNRLLHRGKQDPVRRARVRARLLPINPVYWLMGNEPAMRVLVWSIVGAWGVLVLAFSWFRLEDPQWLYFGAKAFAFVLKMLLAVQACRFFAESRRNGSLEMLLCTPLRNTEILKGQWLAVKRLFFWPMLMFVILTFVPIGMYAALEFFEPGATQKLEALFGTGLGMVALLELAIGLAADSFAVVWFGMWLALTMKKPGLAPALTIIFVLILPSLFLWCAYLIADMFFILWGAVKLQQDLRTIIAQQYQRVVPHAYAPAPTVPPVIAR